MVGKKKKINKKDEIESSGRNDVARTGFVIVFDGNEERLRPPSFLTNRSAKATRRIKSVG